MSNKKTGLPKASKSEKKEVMRYVTLYQDAKMRTQYFPLRRPSFMKRLKVSTSDWKRTGRIRYDREHMEKLHSDDQDFIKQYEYDMWVVFCVERSIAAIKNKRTREIASRGFKDGVGYKVLAEEFGLCRSSIYWEKDIAKSYMWNFIKRKMEGEQ